MQRNKLWILAGLLMASLLLASCAQTVVEAEKAQPIKIEKIEGTEFNRLTLTEQAAKRLDIQTAAVLEESIEGVVRKVIPYAAVLYDVKGATWIYISPSPLTFVRESITIDHIAGDRVILTNGPPAGTTVVTVGVPELYGADTGIGK